MPPACGWTRYSRPACWAVSASAATCATWARYGDEANQFKSPSVTLADAALHYTMPHWRFSVNAQNLFDRIYVGGCQRANYRSYGLRRTVLARATYHW